MQPFLLRKVLDCLLPTPCQICDRFRQDGGNPWFCRSCWEDIPFIDDQSCFRCGRPFSVSYTLPSYYYCGKCQKKKPSYDGCFSAGYYDGPLSKAIHLFKFQKKTRLALPLSQLMAPMLKGLPAIDFLIPVPLHPHRLKEREFNQAFLLTHHLSRILCLPSSTDSLERVKYTPPQVGLSALERKKNMRRAFFLKKEKKFQGKSVLLIDDVFTTGSTVEACARLLKQRGKVKKVLVGTLARVRPA